jgi:hypothetical protein
VSYPNEGPTSTYTYDALGCLSGMHDASNNTVVSGVSYGPANELLGMTYNGIAETRSYNSLLQLTSIVSGPVNMRYVYPAAGSNNGKACAQYDVVSGEQVVYAYDSLNRLSAATAYCVFWAAWECVHAGRGDGDVGAVVRV